MEGQELGEHQSLLELFHNRPFAEAATRLRTLFCPPTGSSWDSTSLRLPLYPTTAPDPGLLDWVNHDALPGETAALQLTFATYNVLSLKSETSSDRHGVPADGLGGPARQTAVLRQLHAAQIQIFGLQETRLRRTSTLHNDHYWLFHAPATENGHFGMMMGFSKDLSCGTADENLLFFKQDDFAVIAHEPRLQIVKVHAAFLKCICINAHAPHTGHPESTIRTFWDHVLQAIPPRYRDWPTVLLTDANARIGSHPTETIGDWQKEAQCEKSESFVDFVSACGLWIPSTFEEFHRGEGGTWKHPTGVWKRNDYICLPTTWTLTSCCSWISGEIDASLEHEDHAAAVLSLCFNHPVARPGLVRFRGPRKLNMDMIDEQAVDNLKTFSVGAETDVHTHAAALEAAFQQCFVAKPQARTSIPRKQSLTAATWKLVCEKRDERKHLHRMQEVQRRTRLQLLFDCIRCEKGAREEVDYEADTAAAIAAGKQLLRHQDHLIAQSLSRFQALGRAVTRAVRQDDAAFFFELTRKAGDLLGPSDVKAFWKEIRRHLPRFKNRSLHPSHHVIDEHAGKWEPYFQQLELGHTIEGAELIADCHRDQLARPRAQDQFSWKDLPSLVELEDALRATQSDRATGLDPVPSAFMHRYPQAVAQATYDLLYKVTLWQSEPVTFKGGILGTIPKKSQPSNVAEFRGILLLPSLAKRFHSIWRKQLMQRLHYRRPPGQLGGFAAQQVSFGSHSIQTFGRLATSHGFSSAILYVDLRNAYHRLIRELVTGPTSPSTTPLVEEAMRAEGFTSSHLRNLLTQPGLLDGLGVSATLKTLLTDVHAHTWYILQSHEGSLTRTTRGTRPGSPLADAIFHVLMADIAREVNEWLQQDADRAWTMAAMGVMIDSILWADDMAIPLAVPSVPAMQPALERLLRFVVAAFHARGFELNFARNKTSTVVTYIGPGAPEARRRFLLNSPTGFPIQLDSDQEIFLHALPKYKHLGTLYAASQDMSPEINSRIGQAVQAFGQMQTLLCGKHLPVVVRLRLFRALVESRLYFGWGSWITPTSRQLQRIKSALLKMLHRVLRHTPDQRQRLTAGQTFQEASVAEPRVRLAVERLLYAQRLFADGPSFLQEMAHVEFGRLPNSWLHGVQADLRWMRAVHPDVFPEEWCHDFTAIIDTWQAGRMPWKSVVKKVFRMHLLQERIACEARTAYKMYFQVITQHGGDTDPRWKAAQGSDMLYPCDCGKAFTTPQGLASHKRLAHQEFSMEHGMVTGATCAHCMRHFWSSARLQQHLSYISRKTGVNACYQALARRGLCASYSAARPHKQLHGMNRIDSIQAYGPSLPERDWMLEEITHLETTLLEDSAGVAPTASAQAPTLAELHESFDAAARTWYSAFCSCGFAPPPEIDLVDLWLGILADLPPADHDWGAWAFIQWGRGPLDELLTALVDGEAESLIEDFFLEFSKELDFSRRQDRLQHLRARLRALRDAQGRPLPHREVRRGHANASERTHTALQVPRAFAEIGQWHDEVRRMGWTGTMDRPGLPILRRADGTLFYLVVHLFSGRRRNTDCHAHLQAWAQQKGRNIVVLSMDTAVSVHYGNLDAAGHPWRQLRRLYDAGMVSATLSGAPCETFSEARHMPPPADCPESLAANWPRPLRSAAQFFGLEGLSYKELRQVRQGSAFFLQNVEALIKSYVTGALYVAEHPALPTDETRVSIWSSPIVKLLRDHAGISLHHISQWRWGAPAVKPTGLLEVGFDKFRSSLWSRSLHDPIYPVDHAIGKDTSGAFRTSQLKEYPSQLSAAFAGAITDQFEKVDRDGTWRLVDFIDPTLVKWVHEAAEASSQIRTVSFLPDYQGG
eukprot:Skav228967  [mRNA]  locus=scaffold671:117523:123045:- [translate_table: standard]